MKPNTKIAAIYHRADFDGIFCREIAKKFLPTAELIGWDYGDPVPTPDVVSADDTLYMLDISIDGLMDHPKLIWIDHHKSAMEKFESDIKGYRIDGVAACRLAWQWFSTKALPESDQPSEEMELPSKQDYVDREIEEPYAVRLAGEYDIWDKRDSNAELFQHGLRSKELTARDWSMLLSMEVEAVLQDTGLDQTNSELISAHLLQAGRAIQYAKTQENESIIKAAGFTVQFEGLTFLACNAARYNSFLFTAGLRAEHDGCLGFNFDGKKWRVSLYGVPGKPDVDLSKIAVKHGGGGHKQACGFICEKLPFLT